MRSRRPLRYCSRNPAFRKTRRSRAQLRVLEHRPCVLQSTAFQNTAPRSRTQALRLLFAGPGMSCTAGSARLQSKANREVAIASLVAPVARSRSLAAPGRSSVAGILSETFQTCARSQQLLLCFSVAGRSQVRSQAPLLTRPVAPRAAETADQALKSACSVARASRFGRSFGRSLLFGRCVPVAGSVASGPST